MYSRRRKLLLNASIAAFLCAGASVFGQQLFWGPSGAGGNGTWDTTSANWWNGTAMVPWTSGATAVFGGTPGSVMTVFSGPTVGGMTFNSPGYVLPSSGWITVAGQMVITTNAEATLDMTMSGSSTAALVKEGAATLTVTGTNFVNTVRVNAGVYRSDDLFFNDVILADAPGATVSLMGSSNSLGSLTGGGTLGGVVQPDSTTTGVSVSIGSAGGPFGGVLKDNGAAKLTVSFSGGTAGQTLTNANTYSGGTTVSGRLTVAGQGSIANTSSLSAFGSTGGVRLDNTATALSHRLPSGVPVTLSSASIELFGHPTTPVSESIGNLSFSGGASLLVNKPGAAEATLNVASITRSLGGTLDVSGSGRVILGGVTPDVSGMLAPYITVGNEFATIGSGGRVEAFAAYATLNAGAATDNVKVSGAGATTLTSAGTRNSLNLQNSDSWEARVHLGGHTLTLASGSILASGAGPIVISDGTLTSGTPEILLITRASTTISANVANGTGAVGLVKKGAGTLTLSGFNTYSGDTTISEGILAVSSEANLGNGRLIFNGGSLRALADFVIVRPVSGATLDTNGFNVTLPGTVTGSLSKTGAGTLALARVPGSGSVSGSVTIAGGAVIIAASTSGTVTMQDSTALDVKGRLTRLDPSGNVRLELGFGRAAHLLIDSLGSDTFTRTAKLKLGFDLGAEESDFLSLGAASSGFRGGSTNLSYLFDFNDLGGVLTGTDYPLISFSPNGAVPKPTLSTLAFAPEALAEGWRGTFKVTNDEVLVNFSAIPEPATGGFLALSALVIGARRHRRQRT